MTEVLLLLSGQPRRALFIEKFRCRLKGLLQGA